MFMRDVQLDPIFYMLPQEQISRVFGQDMVDIDPEFLGFTETYMTLSWIIPNHWTVIDLGCAYAPQAFCFKDHKEYVGVDLYAKERFLAPNSRHFTMPISEFIETQVSKFDLDTTFAICSYVPPWHSNNMALVRSAFKNVFTYYPAGSHRPRHPFDNLREERA